MSVVINDKPRRQRALNWRWPFSRQITLSLVRWPSFWRCGGRWRRCS